MVEWQDVGMALTSLAALASVVWGWVLKQRAVLSETRARVAEDERDRGNGLTLPQFCTPSCLNA